MLETEVSLRRNIQGRQILADKETGVNYLCWKSGYGASITPLLERGLPLNQHLLVLCSDCITNTVHLHIRSTVT